MKTKYFIITALIFTALGIGSCTKSTTKPTNADVTFLATLNGASETPANASTASGSATFTYNPTTYILSGMVNFNGLVATAAHIHIGAVGVAGSVVFPLGGASPTSPISFTSTALTAQQQSDLMNGLYYVNVHSAAYPGGEIRGQLVKQ
jgi:hypothetical protein